MAPAWRRTASTDYHGAGLVMGSFWNEHMKRLGRQAQFGADVPASGILPPKNTPLDPTTAISNLAQAYQAVIGQPPTPTVLALLAAQTAYETGGPDMAVVLPKLASLGFSGDDAITNFQKAKGLEVDGMMGPLSLKAAGLVGVPTVGWQSMPNYNFGGVKAHGTPYTQTFMTTEGSGAAAKQMRLSFAAYLSALDGAKDY